MESKMGYIKALGLDHKLDKEQLHLVWKAMDGYGDYREREADLKNCSMPDVVISEERDELICIHNVNQLRIVGKNIFCLDCKRNWRQIN